MDAYDLSTLFAHREVLEGLDGARPALVPVAPMSACRSIALLPGSFNPPTAAHLVLAERAARDGYGCVAFVVTTSVAGKRPSGLSAEDRLLALRLMTASSPALGVVAGSCPLYADQAEAAARAFPGAEITFLVGSDKVEQIFDPRWYDDREEALERLFARAALCVAPRADDGRRVREILTALPNRRYADHVRVMPLHPAVSDLSSTRVRGLLQSGADPSGLVPAPVADMLAEVRAFAPPLRVADGEVSAYEVRRVLFEALWRERAWAREDADFRRLMRCALDPSDEGALLRDALVAGAADAATLERAQAAAVA